MVTPNEIVQEVLQGKWGNGAERKERLRAAGYSYIEIQSLINKQYSAPALYASIDELATEVLEGRWGDGSERKNRLEAAGQNYLAVQQRVNERIANGGIVPSPINPTPSSGSGNNIPSGKIKVGDTITAKGIDISEHQGTVDFTRVKASGIDFVILREGRGTYIDERFLEYAAGAKSAGIPIHGVYHFCYSINETEAVNEAKLCIQNIQRAGLPKSTLVFYDLEYDSVNKARNRGVILGKTQCIAFTKAFCDYVQSQGYIAGVYSNIDYYNTMYEPSLLNQYVFWVAQWNGGSAPMKKGAYHQWTSSGKVSGINGNVDLDNCYIILGESSSNENNNTPSSSTIDFSQYYGKISNSGKDENNSYHYGQAGDQSREEWNIVSWGGSSNWNCVLRHPNNIVRELIAELAIEAANNDYIGYDQNERYSFWTALQKCGYRPKNITTPCEADCSAGVIAITKAAGHLLNIDALKNITATYTGNMRSAYSNAGFQVLTDYQYISGPDYLYPGDILLNDVQHTATNLGYGKYVTKPEPAQPDSPSETETSGGPSLQIIGTVIVPKLNVRAGPGTSYNIVTQLSKGTQVNILDATLSADEVVWFQLPQGYVCANYIG